jgi:hypothetical protein
VWFSIGVVQQRCKCRGAGENAGRKSCWSWRSRKQALWFSRGLMVQSFRGSLITCADVQMMCRVADMEVMWRC